MNRTGAIAVTGASRGIGAAIAAALGEGGHLVGCLSRKGEVPAGMDPQLAARMLPVRCDVNDEASIRQALATLAQAAGGVWGMVNNAGIHLHGASEGFTTAEFDQVMDTNAKAVFIGCREAYPYLTANGGGVVINIGSFFDKLGVKRNVAYCASKAAVGAITRCLAVEWASQGIRVLDVAPGYIVTDLNRAAMEQGPLREYLEKRIPSGKPGTAADVARLVATLASQDLEFLSGDTIYIDGAQGIAH